MESPEEKQEIWKINHDSEETGHFGFKEIIWKVAEIVFWDSMRKDTARYVQECPVCQKEREYRKTGLGGEVRRPENVWKQVSIDYITKLPRIKGKDSIFVIQDQLSGMIHLKAVSEKESAKQV